MVMLVAERRRSSPLGQRYKAPRVGSMRCTKLAGNPAWDGVRIAARWWEWKQRAGEGGKPMLGITTVK